MHRNNDHVVRLQFFEQAVLLGTKLVFVDRETFYQGILIKRFLECIVYVTIYRYSGYPQGVETAQGKAVLVLEYTE
jgi:hypothetical protein